MVYGLDKLDNKFSIGNAAVKEEMKALQVSIEQLLLLMSIIFIDINSMFVTFGSEWVRTSENESGASRDLASAYVLCLRTLVVPNLQRDKGGSLGK